MKKLVLGMMAAIITFSAMAQSADKATESKEFRKGGKHARGNGNMEKLNLSTEQKAQMKTLNEDFRQQMQDLKKDGNLSDEQQKQKRITLAKEHQQRVAAILTPQQKEQAKELKKDWKSDRKEDKKDGARGDRFDKMSKELNLSADQSSKMAALNASLKNSVKSIKENSTLTADEKRSQMKDLQKQHSANVQNILTAEQKKQLKSHRKGGLNQTAVK